MSSEESENEDIPEVSVCQRLTEEFAEITGTDTACAQFYLQDRKWSLERSVNDFFEDRAGKGALRVTKKNEAQVVLVVDGSNKALSAAATAVVAESISNLRAKPSTSESEDLSKDLPSVFKFITWNIDGLQEKNMKLRTKAVCKTVLSEQADVAFVQEVIPDMAEYFLTHLPGYECYFSGEVGYFVGTFLKKKYVKCENHDVIDFPNTQMMRSLLRVNAKFGEIPLCLLNSHLESTADGAVFRKEQLQISFKEVFESPEERTVIFAGDLNLRDKEITELGGLPTGIEDVWMSCGSRKECAYTFDLTRNDNLIFNGKFKPRCRFDRVYLRRSSPTTLKPSHFGLIGLERLLPHRCFPSDHWGILCHFKVV